MTVHTLGRTARVLVVLSLALGLLGGTAVAQTPPPAPTLAWAPCEGDGFECATLTVPLDHTDPAGDTIDIAVIRRLADDPGRRIGSLVLNPGGPGGSGYDFALNAERVVSRRLLRRFDVVGFDPRGVARSTPVDCASDADFLPEGQPWPTQQARLARFVAGGLGYAADCRAAAGAYLPYITTEATARDMDLLRAGLGDEQLSYLGFSYGTALGAAYAELFPERVRALVLDGALDPTSWWDQPLDQTRGQALAFEASLEGFLAWCGANVERCPFGAGDPAAAYDALLAEAIATGLPGPSPEVPVVAATDLLGAVFTSFYVPSGISYPLLAAALSAAEQGDTSLLLEIGGSFPRDEDGTWPQFLDIFNAVLAGDGNDNWPLDPRAYAALDAELAASAPRLGRHNTWSSSIAPAYLPRSTNTIVGAEVDGEGAAPILVIGSTGDPATPYDGALALTEQLDSAVLLTREGDGHVAYPFSACIRIRTDIYLLTGAPPSAGVTCSTSPLYTLAGADLAATAQERLGQLQDLLPLPLRR